MEILRSNEATWRRPRQQPDLRTGCLPTGLMEKTRVKRRDVRIRPKAGDVRSRRSAATSALHQDVRDRQTGAAECSNTLSPASACERIHPRVPVVGVDSCKNSLKKNSDGTVDIRYRHAIPYSSIIWPFSPSYGHSLDKTAPSVGGWSTRRIVDRHHRMTLDGRGRRQ
jgi:hypothetical protein